MHLKNVVYLLFYSKREQFIDERLIIYYLVCNGSLLSILFKMVQSDTRPTGNQEVAGSIPAGSDNILSWRLIILETEIISTVILSLPLYQEG